MASFFSGVFLVLALLMFITGIGGLFHPPFLKDKKTGEIPSRSKIFGGSVAATALFFVMAAAIAPRIEPHSARLPQPIIPADLSQESASLIRQSWPLILQECPGLVRYRDDWTMLQAYDNFSTWQAPDHAQRVSIEIQVSETPAKIPPQYRVAGHHCFFEVGRQSRVLSVPKQGCLNLCLDQVEAQTANGKIAVLR